MNWIEEEAAKIKADNEKKQSARDWVLQKSRLLAAAVPELWGALIHRCQEDVALLNGSFDGDDARQAEVQIISERQFRISKHTSPFVLVSVEIKPDVWTVEAKTRIVRHPSERANEAARTFRIEVDDRGNVGFAGYPEGVEAVSQALLRPILQAFRD